MSDNDVSLARKMHLVWILGSLVAIIIAIVIPIVKGDFDWAFISVIAMPFLGTFFAQRRTKLRLKTLLWEKPYHPQD
ncbi:MAG: hypothetical protein C4584_02595 [Armatimonadetes bacterium]|nr:MAG: hypothetical protein C4584_02595 [Armatimonadota bacterium]